MKKKLIKNLKGFHPWQLAALSAATIGILLAVIGSALSLLVLAVLGLGIALISTCCLVLLFSRQTWRQLKKLTTKVDQASLEGSGPVYITEASNSGGERPAAIAKVLQLGLDFEWARRMPHIRPHMETFALRSKSVRVRDSIALASTGGAYRYDALRELLAVTELGMIDRSNLEIVRQWDKDMLLTLARLAANQRALESDMDDAIRLFAVVERYFGSKALGRNDRLIYVEVLGETGDLKKQREAIKRFALKNKFPVQAELLRLNSVRFVDGAISERWVADLNALFEKNRFEQIKLDPDTSLAPLDRLRSASDTKIDGPMVSVLVPSFRGGELLKTALISLLEQTWKNLEIIVVDDCSGQDYEQSLLDAENLSPKIKVIRQKRNLGAYCARNAAVAIAKGEYVTVHDDDDWSHPDKISTQVRHLQENPKVAANMSLHARSTDDLKFLRINNNPQFAQPNFSSLMVRRELFDEIGAWDTVNRGADAEFRDRIVTRFGQAIEAVGEFPMSFTRTRDGSLTAGEMSRGFIDPSRLLYLASYTSWHRKFAANPTELRRGPVREYVVPTSMEAGKRGTDLGVYDVVYVTDFRFPGGTTTLTLSEMKAVAQAGKRVGFIQLESPLNKPSTPVSETLLALQASGDVQQLGLGDIAHAKVLVVRHPTVVTYLDRAESKITVGQALLIVNNPPVNKGGSGMVFDLPACIENMDRLFDTTTLVIGESELTRKLSLTLVPKSRLVDGTWPGVITSDCVANPDFGKKPILGRHSRDHGLKWPSIVATFRNAYVSDVFDTQILGGAKELRKKLGEEVTEGVIVHEFGAMEVDSFLNTVDFWAYFHDDKLTESFGMSTAEAMAAGKVVILPGYMETTFGDGAVYAEPSQVSEIVSRYWNDPSLYKKQSEKARHYIAQRYGVEALMGRIEEYSRSEYARAE
ncbi:glycosyltransferase [Paeniglutamicibacter sp. ZC-3]|uniref:glycosyltransferase n=1 Tax=Paeniglutamicibacter sp. ZC-3 TaxID=2986919 RepID=UPI0021F77E95|nr:glycosyltransferase [Paeniglutamicibacter sp. ZC-3]MCV9994110.1 glycosyltransferase [Paeniglutamicibacter sp. ZC-3]